MIINQIINKRWDEFLKIMENWLKLYKIKKFMLKMRNNFKFNKKWIKNRFGEFFLEN